MTTKPVAKYIFFILPFPFLLLSYNEVNNQKPKKKITFTSSPTQ